MTEQEILMQRGDNLARQCALGGVLPNHLGTVLAHLKRHRDPKATAEMLDELARSRFASRTKSTRGQFEGLRQHVVPALRQAKTWQQAAQVVGWAQRLMAVHKMKAPRKPQRRTW